MQMEVSLKIMGPLEYLHLQMKLEGIGLNANGRLARLRPTDSDHPVLLFVHTAHGHTLTYLSDDWPPDLESALATQLTHLEFPKMEPVLARLRTHDIQATVGHFRTYIFPEQFAKVQVDAVTCFPKDDPKIADFGFNGFADRVYVIEDGGVIRAACVSVRQNHDCAESWVFTAPEYRRQGLAQKVVVAWARGMREAGVLPFYSHKIENLASASLASQLDLIPMFEEISVESEH